MSLSEDRDWAIEIYHERVDAVNQDQNVTYFFLKDYQEICRYMRMIGYGSKGEAETVEQQVSRELHLGHTAHFGPPYKGSNRRRISLFLFIATLPVTSLAPA